MKVTLEYLEQLRFSASTRQFKEIHIDEPESFHGTNLAPSPIEYFLIGTGSCIGATFIFSLQKYNIKINNLRIIVDGTLKHAGPHNRLRLIKIDIEFLISLTEDASKEDLELCFKTFQEYCPISEAIIQGIPLNINFSSA